MLIIILYNCSKGKAEKKNIQNRCYLPGGNFTAVFVVLFTIYFYFFINLYLHLFILKSFEHAALCCLQPLLSAGRSRLLL